jgi:hypothetical protein
VSWQEYPDKNYNTSHIYLCCLKLALNTQKKCITGNFFPWSPEEWHNTGEAANDKKYDNPELTHWARYTLKCQWHLGLSMYELVTGTRKPSIWTKMCPTSLCIIHLSWNVLVLNMILSTYISRYGMTLAQKQKL